MNQPDVPIHPIAQPGWYSDPNIPGHQRWWDGERWTVTTAQREAIRRPRKLREDLIVVGILAILIAMGGLGALLFGDHTSPPAATTTSTTARATPAPSTPKAPEAPTTAPTPETVIKNSINDRVDVQQVQMWPDGQIFVTWHIKENLTEGITKDGARRDATDILEGVRTSRVPFTELRVIGKADVIDQLGRTSTDSVVIAMYSKATVDAIQFPTFDRDNIFQPGVADEADIAPPMRD